MKRTRLITVGLVALVLGVVAALMATAGNRGGENATSSSESSAESSAESAPSESPSSPTSPSSGDPTAGPEPTAPPSPQSKVRLPVPSAEADEQAARDAEAAARQRRRDERQRQALVPDLPEVEAGSLECIEAIARRRTLVAATFNIHGGFGRGLDLEGIGREIAGMDADVVLLQEVDRGRKRSGRQDQAAILARRLQMNVAYDPNSGRRSGGTIGNAVLSRFPITSVRRAPLPRGGAEPRGVMRVVVDIDNVEVAAYVTHLEHTSAAVRRRQITYIAKAVRAEGLPHLLGGDLNANPGTDVLGIARRVLGDAWPAAGRGADRTVPRARIDYLMHGPTLRPLQAQVVPSRISDHNAVLGAFEVGPPQACQQG